MISCIVSNPWRRRLFTGLLTWLIPFIAAVPFYGRDGALLIDQMLFKSLMIAVASIAAAIIMVWYFSGITSGYAREAMITGFVWLFLNWALDLVVLVGLLGMPGNEYAVQVGLRYIMIPAMVISAGVITEHALRRQE